MELVNVVCLYWGNKYKTEFVNVLYNMVQRHLTIPHKFIIYTDHVKMQKLVKGDNVEVRKLPFHDYTGWWNKLTLFSPEANLEGDCLYFDLDVVITENIDCFATYEPGIQFVGMNDFNRHTGLFNSSIMRFNNEYHSKPIWKQYIKRRSEFSKFHGDQEIISQLIKKHEDTLSFPDEWTQSYKWYNREGKRYHSEKWTYEQDPNAKVCVFHGRPNPAESTQEWVKELWK